MNNFYNEENIIIVSSRREVGTSLSEKVSAGF